MTLRSTLQLLALAGVVLTLAFAPPTAAQSGGGLNKDWGSCANRDCGRGE